ncbi:MAG: TonB-dependent receptor [Hyphomonadaceae bacterium]|nr:TonB-dependent receptor [Hyphomonadaceae bacterium]
MKTWVAAAGVLLLVAPASAQEPEAPVAGLPEIVITAQRERENLQRAPAAVTVLSGDLLRDAGVSKPQELTHLAPALQSASITAPYSVFYLRGVGNFNGNALSDAAVAFNFNGVFVGRASSTTGFFYDLERIEILKGPQGTLYGRNATGGAVNVLPRRPELGDWSGELAAAYGEHESLRVEGALNIPLGDVAALRAAGVRVRHDGYMADGTDDQDDWATRLSFQLEPNDDLAISIVTDYFDQGGRGPGSMPIGLDPDNRFGISSPQSAAFYAAQRHALAGRNFNPIPPTQFLDNQFWGVSATVDWRTPIGAFTFIPAYRESRLDLVGTATGMTLTIQEEDRQTSFEARLASDPERKLRYLVGAYYFDETNEVPLFAVNSQYNMSIQQPRSGVESAAIFGRVTYAFTDVLRATVGARYTEEEKFFQGSFQSFNRVCPPVPTGRCPNALRFPASQLTPPLQFAPGALDAIPFFNPADGSLTVGFRILPDETANFSRTTWRAALDWEAAPQSLLFASYETGFKSGGFFFSNDSQVFRPERLEAFTLGSKNRFLDDRLQVNLEAFHWRYEDQQVSHITLDSRGVTNLRTNNVGQASIQGVEVELQVIPRHNTLLSLDAQYLDATYDEYAYVTPLSSGPPLSGCAVAPGAAGFRVDCAGKRAPYAPEWTLNLAAEQTIPIGAKGAVVAEARAHYQSRMLTGLDFTPLEYQGAYWSIDAALTWTPADDRYFLSAFASNLTDETVIANTFQPPFGSFQVGTLRPPRTLGLRLGAHF